jgi:hypothetical protein
MSVVSPNPLPISEIVDPQGFIGERVEPNGSVTGQNRATFTPL